jgi:hypothetical protein
MDGTWSEPEDLLREVLRDAGLDDALERMQRLANLRPTGNELAAVMQGLGVGPHHYVIEQERFSLLFRSGREFLFSPLIEFGPLRLWKAIIGPQGNPQELFWRLKESIDTYFAGHVFSATVLAGVLHLRVPETGAASAHAAAETAGEYWRSYPELDAVFQSHEDAPQARSQSQSQAQTQTQTEDMDIDIDMDLEVEPDLMLEPEPDEDGTTRPHPFIRPAMTAEDAAMLALLDQPEGSQADAELDALLDQVLEFAGTTDAIEELSEDEVEEVPEVRKPGETLKRIRALLPPPPSTPGAPPLDNTNEGE